MPRKPRIYRGFMSSNDLYALHNKQLDLVIQWKRVLVMDALNSTNCHDKNDIRLQKIKSILLQLRF